MVPIRLSWHQLGAPVPHKGLIVRRAVGLLAGGAGAVRLSPARFPAPRGAGVTASGSKG